MPNFKMWLTALSTIPQVSKEEWSRLDVVSRWLIMTRSAVTTVTIFSAVVAGLLAWRDTGHLDVLTLVVVALGLFLAHGTNNILNDYTDFSRGVDQDNYFRTEYGPHPLVHGFHGKRTQLVYFAVSGALALLAGLYAWYVTGFDPNILILIGVGAFFLLFYTWPLKYLALGEFSILMIWGPVLICGVYYVLTRSFSWNVFIASLPLGLTVMSINLGKHIDKRADDKKKGVTTLPVLIGEPAARYLDIFVLLAAYGVVLYLILVPRYFTPVLLLVFLAVKWLIYSLRVLVKPRPTQPPEGYPAWPVWFSGFTFLHNRNFTLLYILAVVLDTLLRVLGWAGWWA